MATQLRNLIVEGGAVRGIAYVGAMQVLDHGIEGAEACFQWFEDPSEAPVNRVTG